MARSTVLYRLTLRCCIASVVTCLLVIAIFELTWHLPLNTTERWLTAVHLSAIAMFLALLWVLAKYRLVLLNVWLMVLGAILPTLFIIWAS